MPAGTEITLRLNLAQTRAGVVYGRCDKANKLIGPRKSEGGPMVFDVPVRLTDDGRWLGDFVRAEGPVRRFVYITVRTPEGPYSGRMKIDIHTIGDELKARARAGAVLEVQLPGTGLATIKPLEPWRAV